MKLYLSQILKEANAMGFSQQPNTSFSQAAPPVQMGSAPSMTPAMPGNSLGAPTGMMMPGAGGMMGQQLDLSTPKLTPTI
jgi:hypothetical protein